MLADEMAGVRQGDFFVLCLIRHKWKVESYSSPKTTYRRCLRCDRREAISSAGGYQPTLVKYITAKKEVIENAVM